MRVIATGSALPNVIPADAPRHPGDRGYYYVDGTESDPDKVHCHGEAVVALAFAEAGLTISPVRSSFSDYGLLIASCAGSGSI